MLGAPDLQRTLEGESMADVDAGRDAAPPRRRPGRRALTVLLALGLLVALALAALPYGIAWGIRTALLESGADAVQVGDVDANPFTLRVAVSGLAVTHKGQQVLRVGRLEGRGNWRALLQRRILLDTAAIDDAHVRLVRLADGTLAGLLVPPVPAGGAGPAGAAGKRWGFGVTALQVTKSELRYEAPGQGHALRIEHMTLGDLATWDPAKPTPVHLTGAADGGVLSLDGTVLPLDRAPSAQARVQITALPLSNLQNLPGLAPVLAKLSGNLTLDQQAALAAQDDGVRFAQRGTAEVTDLAVTVRGRVLSAGRLTWDGDTGVALSAGAAPAWGLDGRLAGENLGGDQVPGGRSLRLEGLGMEGRVDGGSGGVTGTGRVRLTALALVRGTPAARIGLLEEASVEGVRLSAPGVVEATRATLKGLVLTPPGAPGAEVPPLLSVGAADLDALRLTRASADVDAVRLSGTEALLVRDADGEFADLKAVLAALAPPGPPPPPPPPPAPEEGAAPAPQPEEEAPPRAPVAVRVGEVSLALGGRVRVRDLAVDPPYEAVLDLERGSFKGLDTAHPQTPGELVLKGTVDRYTQVALHGTLAPLADRLTMDLSGTVTRLDLPSLDRYAAPALGYHLDAGQLDAKVRMGADEGRLDGTADLDLRSLTVSPVKGAQRSVADELSMPLESALDLLKDRDNRIRVTIPVSGDLTDPKLGLGRIVSKGVGKGLKAGVMTYVKVALMPFGAVIEAAELAGKGGALRLDPMPFTAGTALLSERDKTYAAKVAELMNDRPRLSVRLCGRATAKDRQAAPGAPADPDAALLALAQARAEGLKDHLVRVHGVDPGRLLVCRPELDPDPKAAPRVDMLI